MSPPRFFCIGVGPGDPELMTLKAARLIGACDTVAHFAKRGHEGHARRIAAAQLRPGCEVLRFEYPYTTERSADDADYEAAMRRCYDTSAAQLAVRLDTGRSVGLLCEGDPFFYGSAMHLFERLRFYPCEVVPGITGMGGAWSAALMPIAQGSDSFSVLPGTLPEAQLAAKLAGCEAAVIMKTGRHIAKIRRALEQAGRSAQAIYVERATMGGQRVMPLAELDAPAPYFSIVLVPGWSNR